jgi:hypothetical protein
VPFAERVARNAPWTMVADDVAVDPVPAAFAPGAVVDPVDPYAPWFPTILALGIVALLGAIGWSWSRLASVGDRIGGAAFAAPIGLGVAILLACILERVGLPLVGRVGPLLASVAAVASGPLVRSILDRRERVARRTESRA